MAALTQDFDAPRRDGVSFSDPLAAATVIWAGAMYALDAAGNAVPATAGGTKVRAVAQETANNAAGAAGAQRVKGQTGVYRYANSAAAAEVLRGDIGAVVFVADDQTVSKTGTAAAGVAVDVDGDGVWVRVG